MCSHHCWPKGERLFGNFSRAWGQWCSLYPSVLVVVTWSQGGVKIRAGESVMQSRWFPSCLSDFWMQGLLWTEGWMGLEADRLLRLVAVCWAGATGERHSSLQGSWKRLDFERIGIPAQPCASSIPSSRWNCVLCLRFLVNENNNSSSFIRMLCKLNELIMKSTL